MVPWSSILAFIFVNLPVADEAAVRCSILSSTHTTCLLDNLEAKQVKIIIGIIACLIPKLPPEFSKDISLKFPSSTLRARDKTECKLKGP